MEQENRRTRKINLRLVFNVLIVVALVVVIVLLVVGTRRVEYNNDYFVTDDNKIVSTMDKDVASYEDTEYEPPITRMVYYIADEKVKEVKLFFEYDNENDAKNAFNNIAMDNKEWAADKILDGRYVIFPLKSDQYEDMTAEQAKMFSD